jgi:hypothetical protein
MVAVWAFAEFSLLLTSMVEMVGLLVSVIVWGLEKSRPLLPTEICPVISLVALALSRIKHCTCVELI